MKHRINHACTITTTLHIAMFFSHAKQYDIVLPAGDKKYLHLNNALGSSGKSVTEPRKTYFF